MNAKTNPINQLIETAQALEKDREEQAQAKLRDMAETARAALAVELGEVWTQLQPYTREEIGSDGRELKFKFHVNAKPLELAPFVFTVTVNSINNRCNVRVQGADDHGYPGSYVDLEKLPRFLAGQRAAFALWQKRQVEEQVRPLVTKLNRRNDGQTPQEARKVFDELCVLDPSRRSDWQKELDSWLEIYERYQANEREQVAREKLVKIAREAYKDAWKTHRAEEARVLKENQDKLAKLQKRLDNPYVVWKLTYAYTDKGEDVGRIDTDIAWLVEDPLDGGLAQTYLTTVNHGHIKRQAFFNPVKVEDGITLLPTQDHVTAGSVNVPEAGTDLHYSPSEDREKVKEMIAGLGLTPLPAQPTPPDCLGYSDLDAIRGDDMPF